MPWIYVFLAGMIEVLWVFGLKIADSSIEWIGVGGLITFSFFLIMQATEQIPVGTVYAIFTGLGASGVILLDVILFNEPFSMIKFLCFSLIIIGVIGLKMEDGKKVEKEEV